jgi:hypothetical protein
MRWLLRLYPRKWRERYEEEMLAILEEHKVTLVTVFDLLAGALDANLNFNGFTEGVSQMVSRIRSGIVMTFCAFMIFGVGWSMLQRLTDPINLFTAAAKFHPEFRVLFYTDFIVGCLSFLAFVIGGAPVLFITAKRAINNKQKDVLVPFGVAVLCLFLFILSTAILANWQHIGYAVSHIYVFIGGYFIFFAVLLIVGTIAVSLMISRTDFQLSELKYVYVPEIIILLCMFVSVVSSIILFYSVMVHAPHLLNTQDVGMRMFIEGVVLMIFGAALAFMGMKRGMNKASGQLIQG